MDSYLEMAAWVDFGPADEALLRDLWPAVSPRIEVLLDTFYAAIMANPRARRVFVDEAMLSRQRAMLARWTEELLLGPRDEAYLLRRQRVGQVHVDVGLPSAYMFTSMNLIRQSLCDIARETLPAPASEATCVAIARATDLDLAVMSGRYLEGREERQRATLQDLIVSHLPVTVLLLDEAGVVRAATRADTRLFREREVLGRHIADALPPALVAAAALQEVTARAKDTGREIVLARVDVPHDGHSRNFRIAVVPLDDPNARLLIHLEELTDTIAAESRARRSESLAQLGALSAAVAHELRNPLAGISGALQVITRSLPADDRRRPIMMKVEGQVRRLDGLVTELLQFARTSDARRQPVDLVEVCRVAAEPAVTGHPGLAFDLDGEGAAVGDPGLLQQVVLNLVLNAIQALSGEPRTEGESPSGHIQISVADGSIVVGDSGPGVPDDLVSSIFEPFFTTRTRGTGLGLAVCRKLMLAMGGTISLDQRPGEGARFLLSLPLT